MFSSVTFLVILLLTLPVFAVSRPAKYHYTLALLVAGIALTTAWSLRVLTGAEPIKEISLFTPAAGSQVVLVIDELSAFFILVINFTVGLGEKVINI